MGSLDWGPRTNGPSQSRICRPARPQSRRAIYVGWFECVFPSPPPPLATTHAYLNPASILVAHHSPLARHSASPPAVSSRRLPQSAKYERHLPPLHSYLCNYKSRTMTTRILTLSREPKSSTAVLDNASAVRCACGGKNEGANPTSHCIC